jgi:hypothetical protein
MGKASSSKKVARAARAGGKAGKSRNFASLFSVLITVVVALGLVLIVVSRGKTADAVAPKLGDHWHAAYGIYDCDHFLPPLSDVVAQDTTGLHTHGDGLMHMHPFGTKYTGKGANLGNWGLSTGLDVTDTSIKVASMSKKNGDSCGKKKGKLHLKVWDSPSDKTGHEITSDFAAYNPQEFTLWTLAFVPDGTDIPRPPAAAIKALQAPSDVTGATTTAPAGTESPSTTVPGGSPSSTTPGSPTSTPTDAPATTTVSSAPPSTTATSAP